MKNLNRILAVATIMAGIAATAQAQSQTISVQYATSQSTLIGSNTAGVVPVSGWNVDISGSAIGNLTTSTGASTGISLSTVMPYGVYKQQYNFSGGPAGDAALFNAGALSTSSNAIVITLSNLTAADTYELIAYSMSNTASRVQGSLTSGATVFTTYYLNNPAYTNTTYTQGLGTTPATSTVGADYFEWTGITGVTSLTYSLSNQGGAFGDVPGLQLIQTTIPEPSTFAMLAGGLGMLITSQRFRRGIRRS